MTDYDDYPGEIAHLMMSALDDLRPEEQLHALMRFVEMLGASYPPQMMALLAGKLMTDILARPHGMPP